jgi:hypothetical protein
MLALFVAIAMVVPAFSAVYVFVLDSSERSDYRIYFNGQDGQGDLTSFRVKSLYDSFAIGALTDNERSALESRGYVVEKEPFLHTIALNGFSFDTRRGEPEISEDLMINGYADGSTGHYIIQFVGPTKEEWKNSIERFGAKVGDYIPNNAFIVEMNAETMQRISGLDFVQWTGLFHPAFKIRPELLSNLGTFEVEIVTHDGNGVNPVLARLAESQVISAYSGPDFGLVKAEIDIGLLREIASLDFVRYIEPNYEPEIQNVNMQWIHQTNIPSDRKMWDNGLDGTGQLIGYADTGLDFDHNFFRQSVGLIVSGDIYNFTDLSRRKLVRYLPMSNYVGLDPFTGGDEWAIKDSRPGLGQASGHGTMVAGTGAGRDDDVGGSSGHDGIGKGTKIFMQDIGTVCRPQPGAQWDDCLRYIPDDYYDLYIQPYNSGVRIHSNSWGTQDSSYDHEARMTDMFMWNYPDMLVIFSNGNGGGGQYDVGSPATAKSIVSAGAAGSVSMVTGWDEEDVAAYSSPGPTADGRLKPTVTMVGEGYSSRSDGDPWTSVLPGRITGWLGTSYAAPAASGTVAIIRQYFVEGWYPTGASDPAQGFNPSAALMKAILAASGEKMTGFFTDRKNQQVWPNWSQGWGRPNLDKVLYFNGDTRELAIVENNVGLLTGNEIEYEYFVNAGEELKVQLVWTDFPGTLGAPTALVNDLNLEVRSPTGTIYRGNVFSTPFGTSESRPGGIYDSKNPIEGVRLGSPSTGLWKVKVIGDDIPAGPQPFALVVSGDLDRSVGQVFIDKKIYGDSDTINIEVQDSDAPSVSVTVTSSTEVLGEVVALTPVGSGIFRGSIDTSFWTPSPNGLLEVSHNDTITVSYNDISPVRTSKATARVDAAGPIISEVFVRDITNAAATVTWMTDEPSDSRVYWGNTSSLGNVDYDPTLSTYHEVDLIGLETGTKYYFDVESSDWFGHRTTDDFGGAHYTFTTTEKGEIFLIIGDETFPPDRVQSYRDALEWGGWPYNLWYIERSGDPSLALMQKYKAVLWQTGLEQYPPIEDSQRPLISNYTDGGGRFFLSSHDTAWAFDTSSTSQFSSPERYSFLKSKLKVDWKDDPMRWSRVEGIVGDPISGSYASGSRIVYTIHRRGASGDEITGLDAGGNVYYSWKSYGLDANFDNCGIRWISSAPNGTADPNIVWGGYPTKIAGFFFEFTGLVHGTPASGIRGDVLNKTIIWLLDDRYHPVVDLTHPNGGETFSGNTATFHWNRTATPSVAQQAAYYSDDSGQTWALIDAAIPAGQTSYLWDISSMPNGDRYMVRVVVQDSGTPPLNGSDSSDGTFTILRPGGDLIGPLTISGSVVASPNPATNVSLIQFSAIVDDTLRGNSGLGEAEFFVQPTEPILGDFGTGIQMVATDGAFDSPIESVEWQGPVTGSAWEALGNYTVWVHGRDDPDNVPSNGDENWGTFYWADFMVAPPPPDTFVAPPTFVSAELEGVLFQDVRVIWGLSPDDPTVGGAADVVRYDIYRGTIYNSAGIGYTYLGQVAPGLSSFPSVGDGDGDTSNYFYYVEAVDANSNKGMSTEQAGKYTKLLAPGVNLVSTPLIPYLGSPSVLLQTLDFDSAWTYDSFDATDGWKSFKKAKPWKGDFQSVDQMMGIWVNVLSVDYMTVAGTVPTLSSIQLNAGWNLVGYPSYTNDTIMNALAGVVYDRIEGYNGAADPYYLMALNPAAVMHTGEAFWIYLTSGATWDVTQ